MAGFILPPTPRAKSCACGPTTRIPVCLAHLAGPDAGERRRNTPISARFFAPGAGQRGEMMQTGLESYGRRDVEAATPKFSRCALEAAAAAGAGR